MLYSADTDPELREWIEFQAKNGNDFLRSIATAAQMASVEEYTLLRPALVRCRYQYPEPNSTVRTLITDWYRVIYNDFDSIDEVVCAFNRFNGIVFDNKLPQTTIRWAFSIQSLRSPGTPIGLLAHPEDPISHPLPGPLRLEIPHIFISEKLKGVSPVAEWVLLHEMCHFQVPHHGGEFIEVLKSALEKTKWSVLLGAY
jgi:hypothetical protein